MGRLARALIGGLAALTLASVIPYARAEEPIKIARNDKPVQVASVSVPAMPRYEPRTSVDEVASGYTSYMSKPVSETLRGTSVTEIPPGQYQRMVYGNDGPSVVLFASEDGAPSRGLASVFRSLSDQYSGQGIDFFVVNVTAWPKKDPTETKSPPLIALQEGLRDVPSLVMYSPFDITNGETPVHNGGRSKKIDIVKGGLVKQAEFSLAYNILDDWLESNLQPNGSSYVTRLSNSFDPKRINL